MLEGLSLIITDRRSTASPNTDDVCYHNQGLSHTHAFYRMHRFFLTLDNINIACLD